MRVFGFLYPDTGLRFGVNGLGFRVLGVGCGVQVSAFRVHGFEVRGAGSCTWGKECGVQG